MYHALMRWERLATVRTVLLILVGVGAIVAGVWALLGWPAGLIASGVAALFLEFMTGERDHAEAQR